MFEVELTQLREKEDGEEVAREGAGEVVDGVEELGQEAQQQARDGVARMVAHNMAILKEAAGAAYLLVRGQERAGAVPIPMVEKVEVRENRILLVRMENR